MTTKDAAFLGLSPAGLAVLMEEEWDQRGHMPPGNLARGWRTERALYELSMPNDGWWVLLEHPESMAAAGNALGDELASIGIGALDVAVLRGSQRGATVLLADWVRAQVLDDGSLAHGIRYDSRHATGPAWAYWLRKVDDGHDVATEAVTLQAEAQITDGDSDLQVAAARFQIKVW